MSEKKMKIALVEDDINMRKSLEMAFACYEEFELKSFKNPKEALKGLDDSFDFVVTDLTMPGMDGIELAKELGGRYPLIIITGNATLSKAIDSIRLGVKDFITKPFEIQTLISAINKASQEAHKQPEQTVKVATITFGSSAAIDNSQFAVVSQALQGALTIATRAAKTDASVMLLGESGVGKEVFANFIHKNSTRANKPFVAINMAAIPDNLIESELFGYEKGAFTDAQAMKMGRFEMANGGTLFLDEIAEMPYGLQSKLLRALQEKEIYRLGATRPIKIDVRLISATNVDIEKTIKEQAFRGDLYYRLNTIVVKIPPLRERQEEILPIAEKALQDSFFKYKIQPKKLSAEAREVLLSHFWQGNIRELISVCERVAILSDNDTIEGDEVSQNL